MERYNYKGIEIIGIDHGFGNIKTRNTHFRTGVIVKDTEPSIATDVVKFEDKYLVVGEDHKSYEPDKVLSDDYYYLTIAAFAKELRVRKIHNANVVIAAGLPLMWLGEQKENFKNYLMRNKELKFEYKDVQYEINVINAYVFPQGFAAVAGRMKDYDGMNILVDIGNGTMNVIYIYDHKPVSSKSYTDQMGVEGCIRKMQAEILNKMQYKIPYESCEKFLIKGNAALPEKYISVMDKVAREYVAEIINRLKEYEYNPEIMRLVVMGGGAGIVKRYIDIPEARIEYIDDIRATAVGYEVAAYTNMQKELM